MKQTLIAALVAAALLAGCGSSDSGGPAPRITLEVSSPQPDQLVGETVPVRGRALPGSEVAVVVTGAINASGFIPTGVDGEGRFSQVVEFPDPGRSRVAVYATKDGYRQTSAVITVQRRPTTAERTPPEPAPETPAPAEPSPRETREEQGDREYQICLKQAKRVGRQQGPQAGLDYEKQCLENLATGAY